MAHSKAGKDPHTLPVLLSIKYDLCSINSVKNKARITTYRLMPIFPERSETRQRIFSTTSPRQIGTQHHSKKPAPIPNMDECSPKDILIVPPYSIISHPSTTRGRMNRRRLAPGEDAKCEECMHCRSRYRRMRVWFMAPSYDC